MALNIGSKGAVKSKRNIIIHTSNVFGGKADPFTTKPGNIQGLEIQGGSDSYNTDESGKNTDKNYLAN